MKKVPIPKRTIVTFTNDAPPGTVLAADYLADTIGKTFGGTRSDGEAISAEIVSVRVAPGGSHVTITLWTDDQLGLAIEFPEPGAPTKTEPGMGPIEVERVEGDLFVELTPHSSWLGLSTDQSRKDDQ